MAVLALQLVLPPEVSTQPRWLVPALELALLAPLVATNPVRLTKETAWLRAVALALVTALATVNVMHLGRLVVVLTSGAPMNPRVPLQASLLIWTVNVVTAALALWEIDRGGPYSRHVARSPVAVRPDLLFPQMTGVAGWDAETWRPSFVDYLFVSFTTATAFSPTDTLPLSARAKALTTATASVSLLTIAVVAAGAVNAL